MRAGVAAAAAIAGFAAIAAAEVAITKKLNDSQQPVTATSGVADIGGPFTLVDDTGAKVTQAALAGKPSAIYFGYTYCPEVCPTTLADLTRWIGELGPSADKINYAFVTIDPQRDTPKVMHAYLSSFDKRIRGFTGSPSQIAQIAKDYKVYYQRVPTKGGGYLMDHSSMIYLMSPSEKFAGIITYQEKDASAVAKLKQLAAMPASS